MTSFIDRCIFLPVSVGTGAFVVASAVNGFLTPFQAGAVNTATYRYSAELRDASNVILAWEVGTGTYTAGTTTLTRSPEFSSSGNATVSFASQPQVMLTLLGQDVNQSLSINRADIPATKINSMVIEVSGGTATGDFGTGALYTSSGAGPSSVRAIQDAAGTWFGLASQFSVGYDVDLKPWFAPSTFQVAQAGSGPWTSTLHQFSANADGTTFYLNKSRSPTIGGLGAVLAGDKLGQFIFGADDGVDPFYSNVTAIAGANVYGTPAPGNIMGQYIISTAGPGESPTFNLGTRFTLAHDLAEIFPPLQLHDSLTGEQAGNYGSAVTDFAYNALIVDSDGRVVTGNNLSTYALLIELNVDQTSGRGQKYALRAITNSFFTGDVSGDLVGVSGWAISDANQGGTNTGAGAIGSLYGMEASGHAFSGATNYLVVSGGEASAWIDVGASASHRWGWSISGIGFVRGAVSDAGINVGASLLSWGTGLQFASYNGLAPVTTTGTILGSDGSSFTVANWAKFPAITVTGKIFEFQFFKVDGVGNLLASTLASSLPITVTGASATISSTDSVIIANHAGTVTLTLLAAASFPGRWLTIKNLTANTVISASSNVVSLNGGGAGTAILAATIGKWANLQSDGTNWVIMAAN